MVVGPVAVEEEVKGKNGRARILAVTVFKEYHYHCLEVEEDDISTDEFVYTDYYVVKNADPINTKTIRLLPIGLH